MLALIDGDIIAYRVGWTVQDQESFGIPRWRTDEMLDGILTNVGATRWQVYISGPEEDNFRYQIYPRYKESRKNKPKPIWLEAIREHLVTVWGARVACNMEADDLLAIGQVASNGKSVICTIDKDLKQIPGNHYNFVTKEHSYVSELEGLRSFYRQILTGDTADDIPGIRGVGPAKSGKALTSGQSETGMLGCCLQLYKKFYATETKQQLMERIQLNGSLLKIKQKEDEGVWEAPWHLLDEIQQEKEKLQPI